MAAKKAPASAALKRTRKPRTFPAVVFEEALEPAEAIQKYASGQKVRRLTLFEKLNKEPDSVESRRLITASGRYGLTKGSYQAEFLELTPDGNEATSDVIAPAKRLQARFGLAITNQAPFNFLYEKLKGSRMPAKEVMADYLSDAGVEDDQKAECIDTFILNAKFVGLLRTIGGSERIVPIEQVLEEVATGVPAPKTAEGGVTPKWAAPIAEELGSTKTVASSGDNSAGASDDFAKICFYITPIGEEGSEERRHADFLTEYIVKPPVAEFGLTVVRADQMGKSGMIGKQVIEHILNARLVIADLSFHNPNVFYELCLRHTTRLPTVQVRRAVDTIPFDLNQYRTIPSKRGTLTLWS